MKAVIQRVINASVTVNNKITGKIDSGLLVYLGVAADDTKKDADWLAEKIPNLRIMNDKEGIMNLSLKETSGNIDTSGILIVSQFTLLADARKGRRPSWNNAAPPEKAKELYEYFIIKIKEQGVHCETGEFQAMMKVNYTNDGPVTILLDTRD
ncbi:MAG: D-tyrosyl-tRNA(Tyr) deacylase [Treponema sp.]|jgi:D-tyrosyl-tRNA(Tyr) deacylase|nr:D-tyrosyl-tRNA(Tyr) deacylase [Treponema sp.]